MSWFSIAPYSVAQLVEATSQLRALAAQAQGGTVLVAVKDRVDGDPPSEVSQTTTPLRHVTFRRTSTVRPNQDAWLFEGPCELELVDVKVSRTLDDGHAALAEWIRGEIDWAPEKCRAKVTRVEHIGHEHAAVLVELTLLLLDEPSPGAESKHYAGDLTN